MSLVRTYWDGVEVPYTDAKQQAMVSFILHPDYERDGLALFDNRWLYALQSPVRNPLAEAATNVARDWLSAITHGSLTFG